MVTTENGEIIGIISMTQRSPKHLWLNRTASFGMMIIKKYWGIGLGTLLLKEVSNHCKDVGIKRLEATCRNENRRGLGLYLKSGFEIEGLKKKTAFINGRWYGEYVIAKFF